MTLHDTSSPLFHRRTLAQVPQLVGFRPRESVVLLPVRDGAATGALRFDLPLGDPGPSVRAFLGALGRFGRADSVVAVVYSGCARRGEGVAAALRARAREVDLEVLQVLDGAEDRPGRAVDAAPASARAVAEHVDDLLDRHPRAELPARLRSSVDGLLRRAADGRALLPRPALAAALIVSAQRPSWIGHALSLVTAPRVGTPEAGMLSAIALVGAVAEITPRTERAAVLVLLAVLHWSAGDAAEAARVAGEAGRTDPHEESARRLVAALERGERSPWTAENERAAWFRGAPVAQSLDQASVSTPRRICSISSNSFGPMVSGGASCTTGSPRSSARQ
jgi:hypothetical protein